MGDRVGFRRWLLRVALVVAAAVLVGWAGDVRFGSGSDAGGKLATARVMAEGWTCDPDVGWWAADRDPDGELHQLVNTEAIGDQFVQATSPVYQCLVMPFQRAMGPWGPVAVSILGAVAAALAAARIAFRLGGGGQGEVAAFWLVGLAGPAFFYALDVWEHAPALGLLGWAVALALGRPTIGRAVAMGALGGLAVAFRAESAVYLAALVLAAVSVPDVRRRWLGRPLACGAGAIAGAAVVGGSMLFERLVVDGSVRGDRGADLASQAGAELGERLTTGVVTTVGVFPNDEWLALVIGALLCAGLLVHARRAVAAPTDPGSPRHVAAGLAVLVRFLDGLGFVPGALAAAPMGAAGVFTTGRSPEHRWLVRTALLAVPLVLILQWAGNLVAQWGGRYLLASGFLLTAAGCSALGATATSGAGADRPIPRGFAVLVAVSVAIGGLGIAWRIDRSADVATVVDAIESGPADEIILTSAVNLAREAGGTYGDRRWLAAETLEELAAAMAIVAAERPPTVVVVSYGFPLPLDDIGDISDAGDDTGFPADYVLDRTEQLDYLGSPLIVEHYELLRG